MALIQSVSGIRGIYNKDLTEEVAFNYANAYFSFLRDKKNNENLKIVVGMDTRQSSKILKNAVIEALNYEIIDLGVASTPAIQLAVRHYNADGGIIITASHNEPEWNGFKFLGNDGGVLNEQEMDFVIDNFRNNKIMSNKKIVSQTIKKDNGLTKKYTDFVFSIIGKNSIDKIKNTQTKFGTNGVGKKIKIVIDSNGGTGFIAKEILERIGIDVIAVNEKIGQFNRKIEPNIESLYYLKDIIEKNNADFAAGFDCDADRVEIILEDGTLVSGHHILALASCYYLKKYNEADKNKIVVVNDATSYAVRDAVEKLNGKIIEAGVGESNVVGEIYRQNALLGGEGSSGGVIIPPSRCRDGTLSLLIILSFMANEGKKLEELIELLPKYHTINKKIHFFEVDFFDKIGNKIINYYKNYKIISKNDSIKILISENSFVWLRISKTEPNILRIIADSKTKETTEKLISEIEGIINPGYNFQ